MIIKEGRTLSGTEFGRTAAALGSFDALHIGHTRIISAAVEYAKKNNLLSLVQLFSYPEGAAEQINPIEKRTEILETLGVDIVVIERFDSEFKNMTAAEFVRRRLKDEYRAAAVFAGFNYRFGKNAAGNTEYLSRECGRYGIFAFVTECVELDGCVSSTRIREALRRGDAETAAEMMGRPFTLLLPVVHGRHFGRTIGFPTANMDLPKGTVVPAAGVYISGAVTGDMRYPAITNVGAKPTVGDCSRNIETHIIDFDGDLYGKTLEIEFYKRIRGIRDFGGADKLAEQLAEDMERSKRFMQGLNNKQLNR